MTSPSTFPTRFTKIDELTRHQHSCLTAEDECYFLGQYTAYAGFSHSETNNTILNFKKSMDRRDSPEWKYKRQAIGKYGHAFATALKAFELDTMTFVPIPPSYMEKDPLYDDRLVKMLKFAQHSVGELDIRIFVKQTENLPPSHGSEERSTPSEIYDVYKFRKRLRNPRPNTIAIVDDVITKGAHFKAMENILTDQYPGVKVIGLFLARCEFPQLDLSELFC